MRIPDVELGNFEGFRRLPAIRKAVLLPLLMAVRDRASLVLHEFRPGRCRLRYRVGGVLRDLPPPPENLASHILLDSLALGLPTGRKASRNYALMQIRDPDQPPALPPVAGRRTGGGIGRLLRRKPRFRTHETWAFRTRIGGSIVAWKAQFAAVTGVTGLGFEPTSVSDGASDAARRLIEAIEESRGNHSTP